MHNAITKIRGLKKRFYSSFTYHPEHIKEDRSIMSTLETLNFDNLALRRLPLDSELANYVRTVNGACFSRVTPTPVMKPSLVAYSEQAMSLLDLSDKELQKAKLEEYFSGNKLLPGSEPAAHCYCGHQFGHFSGQLGDGAAMYLGEIVNHKGERWEIQLKGAGKTPYSRTADGRKVMRSSIREFLCSEAMYYLGIPTTRAGVCITSDTEVVRDVFYDGNPTKEKCTIVLRIAPTFIRFGSFEIFKTIDPLTRRVGPSVGRTDILKQLIDYAIETFYPQVHSAKAANDEEKYASFFKEVVLRTAKLVAHWQCVGFCHGVLNTDNMSILGLTIDYGPFGFMDMYDPEHVCNTSDDNGRYSYKQQPEVCLWNLEKLSEAIEKVVPLSLTAPILDLFEPEYQRCYMNEMRKKLGLLKELENDKDLVEKLFLVMEETGADFTNAFRCLSVLDLPGLSTHGSTLTILRRKLLEQSYPKAVLAETLKDGIKSQNIQMLLIMMSRNADLAQRLDPSGAKMNKIMTKIEKADKIQNMSDQEKKDRDSKLWDDWLILYVSRLEKEAQDVTSETTLKELQDKRQKMMNSTNPRFILRNYIAQEAIDKAEKGDCTQVVEVLKLLKRPFDSAPDAEDLNVGASTSKTVEDNEQCSHWEAVSETTEKLPPQWAHRLRVT